MMHDEALCGRIVRGIGGFYTVRDASGRDYTLKARGRFRKERIKPMVGDNVHFTPGEGETHGWIDEILPRKTELIRPPAANVSLLVIVVAKEPAPDLLLVDRLILKARQSGFDCILCVNKCDMDDALAPSLAAQYRGTGIQVMEASAKTGKGLDDVRERMRGEICCMAGQSAVGKSTLLNALCGLTLETGGVSERTRRGRHTTRHVELMEAEGLTVLDTPGFSLLSLEEVMEPDLFPPLYTEYAQLSDDCRFTPCFHDREPGCAVRAALERGDLSEERHDRYIALLTEVRDAWKSRYS